MKLSEIIWIKNTIEHIYNDESNRSIPGAFEIKANNIMRQISPEIKQIMDMAQKQAGEKATEDQLREKANDLLKEHADLDMPLKLPRLDPDDLKGINVPRGTYDAFRPLMNQPAEKESMLKKLLNKDQKKKK